MRDREHWWSSRRVLAGGLTFLVSGALGVTGGLPVQAAETCVSSTTSLDNGAFELPVIGGGTAILLQADVPGWSTTDTGGIELWWNGAYGVPSFEGNQFAELNAYIAGTLYQDVATVPGETLYWSLAHRARDLNNDPNPVTDVMRVVIGPPVGPLVQSGPNLSDTDAAWGTHTGSYTVPEGQTTTRFGFQAVSSGNGNNSAGNFLDAISFSGPACVTAVLSVSQATAESGDELTYSLVLSNHVNGAPTTSLVVSVPVPGGTTYKAGSASPTGALNGGNVVFTQPGNGRLAPGGSLTLTFTVTVDDPLTVATATNVATITVWPRNPQSFSSNTVVTTMPWTDDTEDDDDLSNDALPVSATGQTLAETGRSEETILGMGIGLVVMGLLALALTLIGHTRVSTVHRQSEPSRGR